MRVIRLVLSLSLVLAFAASASESAYSESAYSENANQRVSVTYETNQPADHFNHQSLDLLTTHAALIESSLFSSFDTDPDCLTILAFKRPVVKYNASVLTGNVRLSQDSIAQWQLIRGPPLA